MVPGGRRKGINKQLLQQFKELLMVYLIRLVGGVLTRCIKQDLGGPFSSTKDRLRKGKK